MPLSLETAPTEFIVASGIRFAYRRLGIPMGTPLIFLQHFTGNMDSWDPLVVNSLAASRPVIVFDNAGVGKSNGKTPDNVGQMTTDAANFVAALGLGKVDLLGFSLGGYVAQVLASEKPDLVRKMILVGTGLALEARHRVDSGNTESVSMDVLYFLKERTRLIRDYHEHAERPFNEIIRKIEAEEEPYTPPYSEDPEPAFLSEWIEADAYHG